MIRRVTTRGVVIKDNKIFCVVQRNSAGQKVDYWCTPGGGLDVGEPIIAGLEREIIEETGIKPKIGNLLLIQQFVDSKGREQLEMFFHISNYEDFEKIDLKSTSHGQTEIDEFGFVDPIVTKILPKILTTTDFKPIISGSMPPLIINEIPEDTEITVQD